MLKMFFSFKDIFSTRYSFFGRVTEGIAELKDIFAITYTSLEDTENISTDKISLSFLL